MLQYMTSVSLLLIETIFILQIEVCQIFIKNFFILDLPVPLEAEIIVEQNPNIERPPILSRPTDDGHVVPILLCEYNETILLVTF